MNEPNTVTATSETVAPPNAKQRKVPEPMQAYICQAEQSTEGGKPILKFNVLRRVPAGDKDIKEAVKALGHGTYTVLTARLRQIVYAERKSDTIKFES